jgi:pyruvate carboxylase subunit B
VDVEPVGGSAATPLARPTARTVAPAVPTPRQATPAAPAKKKEAPPATADADVAPGEEAIVAPMPGMVIRYEVNVGDKVKAGDVVVVFEAMKMQNNIPSPIDGTVKAINFSAGDSVPKDGVMAVISP